MPSVIIVGGGIIGLATAYQLRRRHPEVQVTLLEKETTVGRHQSSHNSGVLHAGLYYAPGSLKARLAVSGIREMLAFCRRHGIAHDVCGKVVVATDDSELSRLRELLLRGQANGLQGLRWLSPEQAREIEPHVRCVAAVHVPEEGIVDYAQVCRTLAAEIIRGGGTIHTGAEVHGFVWDGAAWHVQAADGDHTAQFIITCGGLHSDRIARMAGARPSVQIVPFRGEYFKLRDGRNTLVRNLVYPVPDPAFPFLGVHFTRMISGGVECGPNAVLAFAREGYTNRQVSPRDVLDSLAFPGFWRFLAKYPGMCSREMWRSFSRAAFCAALQRLVPDVQPDDLVAGGAGVRAQAMDRSGALVQDFAMIETGNALHLLNAPSPGATASLAIGDHLIDRASRAWK